MQKLTPCLWFDNRAEEAANFYASVFKKSKVGKILRYDEESSKPSGKPVGSVLTVELKISGQDFVCLNGGPEFKFSEAVSFMIDCKDQKEVDYFWEKLTADGGEESYCGWLKDKFGLSWQVVPAELPKLINSKNEKTAKRAMAAMMTMRKIDIEAIKRAVKGK